jgi:hypothetical protein
VEKKFGLLLRCANLQIWCAPPSFSLVPPPFSLAPPFFVLVMQHMAAVNFGIFYFVK